MKKLFKVANDFYKPEDGSFGILCDKTPSGSIKYYSPSCENYNCNYWIGCREEFLNYHEEHPTRTRKILFSTPNYVKVRDFIAEVEKRLKVSIKTKIQRTSNPDIILVRRSSYWRPKAKNSLFTALLRAGENYKKIKGKYTEKSFTDALDSQYYLKETSVAVKRFFQGYTRFKFLPYGDDDCFEGWHDEFIEFNEKWYTRKIETVLVKP